MLMLLRQNVTRQPPFGGMNETQEGQTVLLLLSRPKVTRLVSLLMRGRIDWQCCWSSTLLVLLVQKQRPAMRKRMRNSKQRLSQLNNEREGGPIIIFAGDIVGAIMRNSLQAAIINCLLVVK